MSESFPGVPANNKGFHAPSSGPNNTMEYMASGLPFVTASVSSATPFEIGFPFVTSEIYLHVSGAAGTSVRVGFTAAGVNGNNYFVVDTTNNPTPFRIRCKSLFIKAHNGTPSYSLMAGLTTIPNKVFPTLTGSAADPVTGRNFFNSASLAPVWGYKGLDQFPPA